MADAQVVMLVPILGTGTRPDQGLPGSGHPSNDLPGTDYPSQGLPGSGHPSHGLPGSGYPSGQPIPPLPPELNPPPPEIWPGVPIRPETPENPIALPPGTIWPPLPPNVTGKAVVLVWVVGVGYRWTVVEVAQPKAAA